jgi:hypothetical protein
MPTAHVVLPPADYPMRGTRREQLRFLIRYAILAPSTHNTQPWRFRVDGEGVEVWADPSRALRVIDKAQRQLIMSVGAALYNLRVALRRFGFSARVEEFPDARQPELVARVVLGGAVAATELDHLLFEAIPLRRTNRQPFALRPVTYRIVDELARLAAIEGATLTRLHPRAKAPLAEVITAADRAQFGDPAFRKELSKWLVPAGSRRKDGIPFAKKEYGSVLPIGPLIVRTFDIGGKFAAQERQLATGSPVLVVLSTSGDERDDWLAAGQAMEAVLLRGTAAGLSASFLNQPLELDEIRPQVAALAADGGRPQLVLRMGYGPPVEPTPRRPIAEVLID